MKYLNSYYFENFLKKTHSILIDQKQKPVKWYKHFYTIPAIILFCILFIIVFFAFILCLFIRFIVFILFLTLSAYYGIINSNKPQWMQTYEKDLEEEARKNRESGPDVVY